MQAEDSCTSALRLRGRGLWTEEQARLDFDQLLRRHAKGCAVAIQLTYVPMFRPEECGIDLSAALKGNEGGAGKVDKPAVSDRSLALRSS